MRGLCGRFALVVALVLATALSGAASAQAPEATERESKLRLSGPPGPESVPGRVIVKFEDATGPAARNSVLAGQNLNTVEELDLIDAELVRVEGRSTQEAVEELSRLPNVEYAEPDQFVYPADYEDEPRFEELWGLNNTGQEIFGIPGSDDVDVNALEASNVTRGDENLTVAVLDDGVDFSHPDLADRAWVNEDEIPDNDVDDDDNGYVDDVNGWDFCNDDATVHDPDEDYHGTHVAGTIAASENGEGVVGVAPNVKIMALKFLDPSSLECNSVSDAILALGYAKENGVKISNNSWGYLGAPNRSLEMAIRASGQLFVASAGNEFTDNDANPNRAGYPASYDLPNVLSVAAVDNQGNLGFFSNYGSESVDISAPGVLVLSAYPGRPEIPRPSAAVLSEVGSGGGKALVTGFGADEIGTEEGRSEFMANAFEAVENAEEPVVVVDDDGEGSIFGWPDVGPSIAEAVEAATGIAPEVINVPYGSDGPDLSRLEGRTVVWATGQAHSSDGDATTITKPPLTLADQQTLSSFLDGGGKLVLTGMLSLYMKDMSFATDTLGVEVENLYFFTRPGGDAFSGAPETAFAGGSYALDSESSYTPNHARVEPARPSSTTQGSYPDISGVPPGYDYSDGTSMAAPHVAGTAALVASESPDLLDDPSSLKRIVLDSGKPAPATEGRTATGDIVDAAAALEEVGDSEAPEITGVLPKPGATTASADANVSVSFSEEMDESAVNERTFRLLEESSGRAVAAEVSYDADERRAALDPDRRLSAGERYVAVVEGGESGVTDLAGNPLAGSEEWTFGVNSAPSISNPTPRPGSVTRAPRPNIRATIRDPQTKLAKRNITLFFDGKRITNFSYDGSTGRLIYKASAPPGERTVRVVAEDRQGLRTTRTWNFVSYPSG